MRQHLLWLAVASFLGMPVPVGAQEKAGDIPPRYRAIANGGRIRLERILGTPEQQWAGYYPTTAFSADGKRAIYVEDHSSDVGGKPVLRSRLLVSAPQSMSWPREIELRGKQVTALAVSADGDKVLLGGISRCEEKNIDCCFLSFWDVNTGMEIKTILTGERGKFGSVKCVALAADHATALIATHTIERWDLKTGKLLDSYYYDGKVKAKFDASSIAYLPGDKQFLAKIRFGVPFGHIRLFNIDAPQPVRTYLPKRDGDIPLGYLAPSADGKRFAAGDSSSATLWDMASGKEINTFHLEKSDLLDFISALTLAPDKKTVLLTMAKFPNPADHAPTKLYAWDGAANKVLWSHVVPYYGRVPMRVIGDKLLIGGGPNLFEVWDWKQGKKLQSWGGHKGAINALAVMQNGSIVSAGQEGSVLNWRDGLLVGKTPAHLGAVVCMAMSRDQKQWLTAGTDQTVKLWRDQDAKPVHVLKGHGGAITSLAFSSDGKLAATGSGDRTAKIWDLTTGKEIASFAGHSEGVNAVAISPDDRWLATGSDDTTIRVWPIKDGKHDASREAILLEKHTKPVTCLLFTPDGKSLLSGSQDQKLMSWNWQKGSMDFMIPGHKNWINSILLLDAKTVLTSSDDLSVCAWDLATGMEIGRIDFGAVGDCPRCLARLGADRFIIGTSSWMVYEFQLVAPGKSTKGVGSSLK